MDLAAVHSLHLRRGVRLLPALLLLLRRGLAVGLPAADGLHLRRRDLLLLPVRLGLAPYILFSDG